MTIPTKGRSNYANAASIRVLVWFTLNPAEELRIEVLMRKFGFKSLAYTRNTLKSMVYAGWLREDVIESLLSRGGVSRVYSAGPRLTAQVKGQAAAVEDMRQSCIDLVARHGGSIEIEAAIRALPAP